MNEQNLGHVEPLPIETAPRDGTEIWLLSLQYPDATNPDHGIPRDYKLVSIHNGYWAGDGWNLGEPRFDIRIGDGCATHWLPRSAIRI